MWSSSFFAHTHCLGHNSFWGCLHFAVSSFCGCILFWGWLQFWGCLVFGVILFFGVIFIFGFFFILGVVFHFCGRLHCCAHTLFWGLLQIQGYLQFLRLSLFLRSRWCIIYICLPLFIVSFPAAANPPPQTYNKQTSWNSVHTRASYSHNKKIKSHV